VWIHDGRKVPVRLTLNGDTESPRTVRAENATLAADAMWLAHGMRDTLIAPGQTTFVPVGDGSATITVGSAIGPTNTYIIADGLVTLIGAKTLNGVVAKAGKANAAAGFVAELTSVFQKYANCLGQRPSIATKAKCSARVTWDVGFGPFR
jgi:hypothetical protein